MQSANTLTSVPDQINITTKDGLWTSMMSSVVQNKRAFKNLCLLLTHYAPEIRIEILSKKNDQGLNILHCAALQESDAVILAMCEVLKLLSPADLETLLKEKTKTNRNVMDILAARKGEDAAAQKERDAFVAVCKVAKKVMAEENYNSLFDTLNTKNKSVLEVFFKTASFEALIDFYKKQLSPNARKISFTPKRLASFISKMWDATKTSNDAKGLLVLSEGILVHLEPNQYNEVLRNAIINNCSLLLTMVTMTDKTAGEFFVEQLVKFKEEERYALWKKLPITQIIKDSKVNLSLFYKRFLLTLTPEHQCDIMASPDENRRNFFHYALNVRKEAEYSFHSHNSTSYNDRAQARDFYKDVIAPLTPEQLVKLVDVDLLFQKTCLYCDNGQYCYDHIATYSTLKNLLPLLSPDQLFAVLSAFALQAPKALFTIISLFSFDRANPGAPYPCTHLLAKLTNDQFYELSLILHKHNQQAYHLSKYLMFKYYVVEKVNKFELYDFSKSIFSKLSRIQVATIVQVEMNGVNELIKMLEQKDACQNALVILACTVFLPNECYAYLGKKQDEIYKGLNSGLYFPCVDNRSYTLEILLKDSTPISKMFWFGKALSVAAFSSRGILATCYQQLKQSQPVVAQLYLDAVKALSTQKNIDETIKAIQECQHQSVSTALKNALLALRANTGQTLLQSANQTPPGVTPGEPPVSGYTANSMWAPAASAAAAVVSSTPGCSADVDRALKF